MASTKLQKTFSSAGNRKTFTFAVWIKRASVASQAIILDSNYSGGANEHRLFIENDDILEYYDYSGSAYQFRYKTNRKLRDVNGWYHIVCSVDTTQGTAGDRVKIYINGVRETSFSTATNPSQNHDCILNNDQLHQIGTKNTGVSFFNGSMSHIHFIDGTAYAASTFGSTDSTTGEWNINTSPSVTYGTNGFFILKDGNTITDSSPNSNNFTVGGGTLTKTEDCPDNVFATMNPLENHQQQGTYTNGNNTYQTNSSNYTYNTATLGVNSGKFYWEVEYDAKSGGVNYPQVGITSTQTTNTNQELGNFANDWGYGEYDTSPKLRNNNTDAVWGSAYVEGDIIGVALDCDNNKLYFSKNGTWQESGNPTAGSGGISITAPSSTPLGFYFPSVAYYDGTNNGTFKANFGNGYFGTTAVSSAGTNASNNGIFEYDVPTGYTALSTKGLNL